MSITLNYKIIYLYYTTASINYTKFCTYNHLSENLDQSLSNTISRINTTNYNQKIDHLHLIYILFEYFLALRLICTNNLMLKVEFQNKLPNLTSFNFRSCVSFSAHHQIQNNI